MAAARRPHAGRSLTLSAPASLASSQPREVHAPGGPAEPALPLCHAVALGALQGVAEVLPISSSGHLTLVPAMLRWRYLELDPGLRKAFEVAVHTGSALALAPVVREDLAVARRALSARDVLRAGLAVAPPALAGALLERRFDEQLSRPQPVAAAQLLAGLAMALADLRPATRRYRSAGSADYLALGLAQAAALVPGVSRNGSTLTAARVRGFSRPAATRLSRQAALPVVAGAAAYKGARLAREGLPRALAGPFAAGLASAALATLTARGLLGAMARARSYAPLGAYRVTLGAAAIGLEAGRRRRGGG
jgi:undecaprenyl-diphosphatase